MTSRSDILRILQRAAMECYPEVEARQIAEMIVMQRGGITRSDILVDPHAPLDIADVDAICEELRSWRPVQYILGTAYFADMDLEVREGVLIPRPETEELVEWIAADMPHAKRILDVCTGSGCIALALARSIAQSDVCGIDISTDALAIAQRNAERYAPRVKFLMADALADFSAVAGDGFDVIVSNPPYIPEADRAAMRPNVTRYEPDMALFVPDDDPLLFYRAIAHTSRRMLAEGGRLYFEIYETQASAMATMLSAEGYSATLRDDFRGKPRMICATRTI